MSEVDYEEGNLGSNNRFQSRTILGMPETPKMVGWVMKIGVRDEKVAGQILMVCILLFILTAFLYPILSLKEEGSGPKYIDKKLTPSEVEVLSPVDREIYYNINR
jgi:hypothetical protein